MPFHIFIRNLLEHYTNNPPSPRERWSGPWNAILCSLFPITDDYAIVPHRRIAGQNLLLEVANISTLPNSRAVLLVDIAFSQDFEHGRDALMKRIRRKTEQAFAGTQRDFEGTAVQKVYWIGTIGSHWIYGEKEDNDQDLRPLIDWHHITHDDASYQDFLELANLVHHL